MDTNWGNWNEDDYWLARIAPKQYRLAPVCHLDSIACMKMMLISDRNKSPRTGITWRPTLHTMVIASGAQTLATVVMLRDGMAPGPMSFVLPIL